MTTGEAVLKKSSETVGSWIWYVHQYKEKHPDAIIDYKALLQQYIKGAKV